MLKKSDFACAWSELLEGKLLISKRHKEFSNVSALRTDALFPQVLLTHMVKQSTAMHLTCEWLEGVFGTNVAYQECTVDPSQFYTCYLKIYEPHCIIVLHAEHSPKGT